MANPFITPVGSVDYSDTVRSRKNRHGGTFSENNPYLDDLSQARSKQDQDAIYNMAMQWEATYANMQLETEIDYQKTLEQREYDYKTLQEQRAYEDPSARIARERAAGLNPDLAGAGNSAGSGGATIGAGRPMPGTDVEGVDPAIPTKNHYQSQELIQRGFDTASGFISSLSSFIGTAVGGFSALRKMPSEIALNEAQADAATMGAAAALSQSFAANTQASASYMLAKSKVASDEIARIYQNVGLLSSLSQHITPEMPDADALDILSALGYSDEDSQRHLKNIRTLGKTPALLAFHHGANIDAKEMMALDELKTPELIGDIISYALQAERYAGRADFHRKKVDERIQSIIANDPKYAQNVADGVIIGSDIDKQNLEFEQQKLERDIHVWALQLESIKYNVAKIAGEMKALDKIENPEQRKVMKEQLNMRRTQMILLGSNEFSAMYDIMNDVYMKTFYSSDLLGDNVITESDKLFTEMTFNHFMQSGMTGRDLADSITKNFMQVGIGVGTVVGAVKGAKSGAPQPSTTTTTTTEERYKGKQYTPYRRTITTTTK